LTIFVDRLRYYDILTIDDAGDVRAPVKRRYKMRHGKMTRDEAIAIVGVDVINKLDATNCEPTSRLQCDGDDSTEYSAYIRVGDVTVVAYYYTTPEQERIMAEHEGDGSYINWEIEGYEIY